MKPKVFFSLVVLAFILHSCNSEKKEIMGPWVEQDRPETYSMYYFSKNGTYESRVYNPASPKINVEYVFQSGSAGYYRYIGPREFNLYPIDIDLSPILGKSVTDAAVTVYIDSFLESHMEPDWDSTKPSFLAQIQGDGEHLHILQNDDIIIELRLKKKTRFLDMR